MDELVEGDVGGEFGFEEKAEIHRKRHRGEQECEVPIEPEV